MVQDAFGLVALVAMTPLIAIQILGLVYKIKQSKTEQAVVEDGEEIIDTNTVGDDDIIDL